MSVAGIVALTACFASILAKIIFTVRIRNLERQQEMEHGIYQTAKNELHSATQTSKRLEAEQKQLESRRSTTERAIKSISGTLQELQTRKREDDAVRAYQKELIKGKSS